MADKLGRVRNSRRYLVALCKLGHLNVVGSHECAECRRARSRCNRMREYARIHPSTDKVREWRSANPERNYQHGLEHNARRRAWKHGSLGSHSTSEWRAIVAKQKSRCADCGNKSKREKDHIVPLSRGGSDMAVNQQGLCRQCNARKSNRLERGTQMSVFDRVAV